MAVKIVINGQEQSFAPITLAMLVEQLGMKQDRVAVERNRNIVPREQWATTQLADGDQLEIVHFVGGGSFLVAPASPPAIRRASCPPFAGHRELL
jgi:thiamine biosynthesis protein ThiS